MTRVAIFALFAAGVVASARADVPVAPPPREIRADGSRDPVPTSEPAKKEHPRAVFERIIKNSNAVGDKLAMTDTGTDTRKTQAQILKDIDALLNQDNPPPKSDQNQDQKNGKTQDMNKDMNKDKDTGDSKDKDNKQDMKQDMKGGMGDTPPPKKMDTDPMGGTGGMNDTKEPMGGDQPKERRPRQGDNQARADQKEPDMKQSGGGGKQQKPDTKGGKPKETKAAGNMPDPKEGKPPPGIPLVPTDDEVVKDVWGHLPDKLRQQATQYYKQEIMPRYAELLKRYYSSMAEKKP